MSHPVAKRPKPSLTPVDIIVFVVSLALFVVGLYLFGWSFSAPVGTEFWVFWAGLLIASFAFLLPMIYTWTKDPRP
ncbi:hypothetical protein [Brevibacterium sp.]|uniref:hypothetical protein n=1 Tax=Brevibacterium sp. TaxID=1701 RepID=UPI0028114383|nr:hypothetical protein [Brevibacterium sp.]